METVGQMIRRRREAMGLTLDKLAHEVGITKGYISLIENARVKSPPSRKVLAGLEKALGIQDGELMRAGEWESTPPNVRKQVEKLSHDAERGKELAAWIRSASRRKEGGRNLDKLFKSGELNKRVRAALGLNDQDEVVPVKGKGNVLPAKRYRVPLINKVAAGYPEGFTDLDYPARIADEYIACPDIDDPQAFAARVVGDSMTPEYKEGDVIVFSPQAEVADGADCFVRLEPDHESTFKRVFFDGKDKIRIQPLNAKYPSRTVDRKHVAGLYKAVWKIQKL